MNRPAAAILLLACLGVAAFLSSSCGGEPAPDPPAPPPEEVPAAKDAPPEVDDRTVTEIASGLLARFGAEPPRTTPGFLDYLRPLHRLWATPGLVEDERRLIRSALETVYTLYVRGPGADDERARAFLGHRRFTRTIPDALTHRNFPFLRAVEWAATKRWFTPDEAPELALAEQAWERTEHHVERLIHDPEYNAGDRVRASLGYHEGIDTRYLIARWAPPYLICHVSPEPTSPFDALPIAEAGVRRKKLEALADAPAAVEAALDEKARLLEQVYGSYLERYREPLSLTPLTAAWGGRPDYPEAVRSYRHGVALIVWSFADREAFEAHYRSVYAGHLPARVVSFFRPRTGHVYVSGGGSDPDDRAVETTKIVRAATNQLQFWFYRQHNRWRMPRRDEGFFQAGFPAYRGAVIRGDDGSLRHTGLDILHLQGMQELAARIERRGQAYPVFPLERLVGFRSHFEAEAWGARTWKLGRDDVLGVFFRQSWALVHFLNHAAKGVHREGFDRYHRLRMLGEPPERAFREAFRLHDKDDWESLDRAFRSYVKDHLLKLDPKSDR